PEIRRNATSWQKTRKVVDGARLELVFECLCQYRPQQVTRCEVGHSKEESVIGKHTEVRVLLRVVKKHQFDDDVIGVGGYVKHGAEQSFPSSGRPCRRSVVRVLVE